MPVKYTLNWPKLVRMLLRPRLRTAFWQDWLLVLLAPLVWLHGQFLAHRQLVLRRRAYNGQVYRLELMLNSEFFSGYDIGAPPGQPGRDVYIETVADTLPFTYLYLESEDVPSYVWTYSEYYSPFLPFNSPISPRYLRNFAEYILQHDFIVHVPANAWNSWSTQKQEAFRSWLNQHKLAGKRYKIKTY
jgi:hypothetical protein